MNKSTKALSRTAKADKHDTTKDSQGVSPGSFPKALALNGAQPLTLKRMEEMPAVPARNLKEMTLHELEAADRGLRAMPERLEHMSGVCGVLSGLVLVEIKSRLEHKQWTPWLKHNYGKSVKTAQRCMRIADAFSKSDTRVVFAQQLTLALLDDTQTNALDVKHPAIQRVVKWTDGRSFRRLIDDEVGDGRAANNPGFRPNALILRAWLVEEYPKHPEYLDAEAFTELPAEVQKRFKEEGDRYAKRLTKERRAELEKEEEARAWNASASTTVNEWHDAALFQLATDDQNKALETALDDLLKAVRKHRAAGKKGGNGK